MNKILKVATLAGQMILENGGETYRVEETIWRICKIYGAEQAESFATPTGIMASICHGGKIYSLSLIHIYLRLIYYHFYFQLQHSVL